MTKTRQITETISAKKQFMKTVFIVAVCAALGITAAHVTPATAISYSISHYGTTGDGYLGGRTACGKTVYPGSMYVATLNPSVTGGGCGQKLTIYYNGKKYWTRIQDKGGVRYDGRILDAAPGLRARMGFSGVAQIRFSKGWK